MAATPVVSIRPSLELGRAFIARADTQTPSWVMGRDIQRYYEVLRRSMPEFSVAEASLIVDALNGCRFETDSLHHVWANVDDAVRCDGINQGYEIDGSAFVERLRSLSYAQMVAVVDAVERYWVGPYHQDGPMEDRLREVGLVK